MFTPGQRVRVRGKTSPIIIYDGTLRKHYTPELATVIDPSLPRRDYPRLDRRDDEVNVRFDDYDYGPIEGNCHTVSVNWEIEPLEYDYTKDQTGDTEEDI